jgi:hypothetical protein
MDAALFKVDMGVRGGVKTGRTVEWMDWYNGGEPLISVGMQYIQILAVP